MCDVVTFDDPAAAPGELDLVKHVTTIGKANLVDEPVTVADAVGRKVEVCRGVEPVGVDA